MNSKNILILTAVILVAAGVYFLWLAGPGTTDMPPEGGGTGAKTEENGGVSAPAGDSSSLPPSYTPIYEGKKPEGPKGRVVFFVSDEAASLNNLKSIYITVDEISARLPGFGTVTVTNIPRTFDLLALYKEGKSALLLDTALPQGTYDQVSIVLGKIEVVELGGAAREAVLPSSNITVPAKLEVKLNQIAAVEYDFVVTESLFQATRDEYVFLPVIKIRSLSDVDNVQIRRNAVIGETIVDVFGGLQKYTASLGMDENGVLKQNFSFGQFTKFEVVGGKIVVK